MNPIRAALFDMDKTLLRANSARLFMEYRYRRGEVSRLKMLQVAWWLAQYSVGAINAEKVARESMREYTGTKESDLRELCDSWMREEVIPLISPRARQKVEDYQKQGVLVAIVTSSTPYGTEPVARELGIDHCLCTELEVAEGRFTGNVDGELCYGRGKVEKARALLDPLGLSLSEAAFYSDSITDLPLLSEVRLPVAVNPDRRLKREAAKRGWESYAW